MMQESLASLFGVQLHGGIGFSPHDYVSSADQIQRPKGFMFVQSY
jgi:hypothetical protein